MVETRMDNSDVISVIVPVYNIERYLPECIESILEQTYRELEIILVDDGSTDQSGIICDRYAETDNRIRVIHKENGGLSSARNSGIDISCGSYLGFVDGDDCIHKQMYEILYRMIRISDAQIAACGYSQDAAWSIKDYKDDVHYTAISKEEAINYGRIYIAAWNKLYKKDLFNTIRYPLGVLHEDEYVYHELLWRCSKVVYTEEKLYYYRKREESITSCMSEKRMIDACNAYESRIQFIIDNNWDEVLAHTLQLYLSYLVETYFYMKNSSIDHTLSRMCENRSRVKELVKGYKKTVGGRYKLFAFSPWCYRVYMKLKSAING
ncbi:MAG: glycosyltransferase [Lachnospiraceae bacterium]|nr:glycosyltransferase [Lachnospiraceae bacterium]